MASSTADAWRSPNDRWLAGAAWIITAIGAIVAALFLTGIVGRSAYTAMSLGGTTLAIVGVWRNRPKPAMPWVLLITFAVLCAGGEALRATFTSVVATRRYYIGLAGARPRLLYLVPDIAEVAGYVCLLFGFERILRARRGSDNGTILDVALVLVGAGALTGQILLAPLAKQQGAAQSKLLAAAYPVLDIAALFLVLLVLFTFRRHNPSSRFLFALLGIMFAGDVISALAMTELTHLHQQVADSLYIVSFSLFAASMLHPTMRELTEPERDDSRTPVGPRRLVLVAIGLCAPTVYAILQPSRSIADRLVLSGACICLSVGIVYRGWQALAAQTRADARLSAITKQANDLFIVADAPNFVVRYTATSLTTALASLADLMQARPLAEFFGQQVVDWLKSATGSGRGGPIEVHIHPHGQLDRHLELTWTQLDRDAFPGSVLLACRDITERARAREQGARAQCKFARYPRPVVKRRG